MAWGPGLVELWGCLALPEAGGQGKAGQGPGGKLMSSHVPSALPQGWGRGSTAQNGRSSCSACGRVMYWQK